GDSWDRSSEVTAKHLFRAGFLPPFALAPSVPLLKQRRHLGLVAGSDLAALADEGADRAAQVLHLAHQFHAGFRLHAVTTRLEPPPAFNGPQQDAWKLFEQLSGRRSLFRLAVCNK